MTSLQASGCQYLCEVRELLGRMCNYLGNKPRSSPFNLKPPQFLTKKKIVSCALIHSK